MKFAKGNRKSHDRIHITGLGGSVEVGIESDAIAFFPETVAGNIPPRCQEDNIPWDDILVRNFLRFSLT